MLSKLGLKIKLLLVASLLALTTWGVFEYQQTDWAYVGEMDMAWYIFFERIHIRTANPSTLDEDFHRSQKRII